MGRDFRYDRDFDAVEQQDGTIRYIPKPVELRKLAELNGNPPWTIVVSDMDIIPHEATDLVGYIEWRGIRFARVPDRDWDTEACND